MTTKACLLAITLSAFLPSSSPAQTASAPAPEPSAFDKFLSDAKKPTDWLTWGADIRARNEYYDNIVTLSDADPLHEQDVIRFRGRLWTSLMPVTNVSINARLSAEPREWFRPSFVGAYRGQSGMEWRYGIFDNLNVKWDRIFDQPLSITAGRQDIMLGDPLDWWLVADGTPGDGSWTFFLDSIRLTYEAQPLKTKFDVIYIYQNPEPGEWLPTLGHSRDYPITDQREQGLVLYASHKPIKNMQIDGYFMYKNDNREPFTVANANRRPGDNADIFTVGGKITGAPLEHWQYSLEGAYQFGTKEDTIMGTFAERDMDAFGGKLRLTYLFKDSLKNQLSLVGEYLSGDDPSTDNDEMFDVLWGRWPRWSELYIYSYIFETGGKIAQLNNVGRIGPQWSFAPLSKMNVSLMYNALFAPQEDPTRRIGPAADRFSYDGNFRGHYLQSVLKYQFTRQISGHLWGEWIWQGDYYAQRDLMSFIRAEVMFTF